MAVNNEEGLEVYFKRKETVLNSSRKPTAHQIKQNCLNVFGPSLGPVVYEIDKEVVWMCAKWQQHRILFDDEVIPLLQNTAKDFFVIVNIVFVYDVILSLTRLTDPYEQGKYHNLSLYSLVEAMGDEPLRQELEQRIVKAKERAQFARDWRNKHIAHRIYPNFEDPKFNPLPALKLESIDLAIRAVCDVLVFLYQEKMKTKKDFQGVIICDDAKALIAYLEMGYEYEKKMKQMYSTK